MTFHQNDFHYFIKGKRKADKRFQRVSIDERGVSLTANVIHCTFWGSEEFHKATAMLTELVDCPALSDYEFKLAENRNGTWLS